MAYTRHVLDYALSRASRIYHHKSSPKEASLLPSPPSQTTGLFSPSKRTRPPIIPRVGTYANSQASIISSTLSRGQNNTLFCHQQESDHKIDLLAARVVFPSGDVQGMAKSLLIKQLPNFIFNDISIMLAVPSCPDPQNIPCGRPPFA